MPLPQVNESEIAAFFASPAINEAKEMICEIGRRLWQRAYVDGNGGNISVRVASDLVLCTPTLTSKGFMKPSDLCLVDMQGQQKAGEKKRTSEALMHLEIYKAQPLSQACVHAHPPTATGFAVAGMSPPSCLLPEVELICGEVPLAPYQTPGSPEIGQAVAALMVEHNTVLMANHGMVAWGTTAEEAYFRVEILESYCQTVLVARQLGATNVIPPARMRELFTIKQRWGIPDQRIK
jgi:L-fuculose-phosphate aldolase